MAGRLSVLAQHLVQQPCATAGTAGLESPSGKQYPANTADTLKGNLEPVTAETSGPLTLVQGALPADLDGQFIRNGPNPFLERYGRPYHEFEGDAMLHAVDIKEGSAFYRNRWVRTQRLEKDRKAGKPGRAADYIGSDGISLGAANTALVFHATQLLALYETDRPYVISCPSLETVGQMTYGGSLDHNMTAHPKVCPHTGELMFFGYSLLEPKVLYGVANSDGEHICRLEVPTCGGRPCMMHDMAITKNFSVLLEFPLYFDLKRAMKGSMPFVLDTGRPSMFGILPRHATSAEEVRWFRAETAMAFHCANAWEEGSMVKLIGCPTKHFSFEYQKSSASRLYEWCFDLDSGLTTERELDSTWVEFPVVHPKATGSRNRYVFAARFSGGSPPFHSINGCIKYDYNTGDVLHHSFLEGRWGGECVFVPRAMAEAEDDGYLLTYTYNPKDFSTELYIVDAKTMAREPIAILQTPQRVPFGFHGLWLPRNHIC